MLKFFAIIFLTLLCSCSNIDDIDVVKAPRYHVPEYSLQNRNPYGFICVPKWKDFYFVHDSVFLVQLDEYLNEKNVFIGEFSNEHNWYGCDQSTEFNFHDVNLNGPYVRFDVKGYFINHDSVKVEATLSYFADMWYEDHVYISLSSTVQRKRVENLAQNEAYPLQVAKIVADKEYSEDGRPFSKTDEEMWMAYVDLNFFVEHLFFQADDLADNGKFDDDEKVPTLIVDSVLAKAKSISDDYAKSYKLPACNGDSLESIVRNKESLFNGKKMVCSFSFWRLEEPLEDSLGACTSYNRGDTIDIDNLVYICDSAAATWRVADLHEMLDYRYRKCSPENVGDTLDMKEGLIYICDEKTKKWHTADLDEKMDILLGECESDNLRYEKYLDSLYYCNSKGKWEVVSQMEFEIGKCGDDIGENVVKKYDEKIWICLKGGWKKAPDSVVNIFVDSIARLTFVEELDSVDFFCSGKKGCAFSEVDSIYLRQTDKGYSTISYGGKLWMKGQPANAYENESVSFDFFANYVKDQILTFDLRGEGYYYTFENAQKQCPAGFHIPDTTEWNHFRKGVDAAAIPDKSYTYIYFVLTPEKLVDNYTRIVSASWSSTRKDNRNVYCYVDSSFVTCPINTYPVGTSCVMDVPLK